MKIATFMGWLDDTEAGGGTAFVWVSISLIQFVGYCNRKAKPFLQIL